MIVEISNISIAKASVVEQLDENKILKTRSFHKDFCKVV